MSKIYDFETFNENEFTKLHFNANKNIIGIDIKLKNSESNVKIEYAVNGVTSDLIFLSENSTDSTGRIVIDFENSVTASDLFVWSTEVDSVVIYGAEEIDYDKLYPNLNDTDLGDIYRLENITVRFCSQGKTEFSVFTSVDGENFDFLQSIKTDEKNTVTLNADGKIARYVRVYMEYATDSQEAFVECIEFIGEKTLDFTVKPTLINIETFEKSRYNTEISEQDSINEVYGIITRQLGEKYKNWFVFELVQDGKYDYFTLKTENNKIKIIGNSGVSLACGLNFYLKNYCKVHISQVGSQVRMPESIVLLNNSVHRETKTKIRYAYNYCTHSYTMAFWGEEEWRRELDWLALNGVNTVLDITAQEEVWRRFLQKIGYSLEDVKKFIAGPAFYAWSYMANLYGHSGPVHNSWFAKRTELARKNQLIMRRLGIKPILQGYSGMIPVDLKNYDSEAEILPQGIWCSTRRPDMLKTTSKSFEKYAKMFYSSQQEVYGDITNLYATDPFHEGGVTGDMLPADISEEVLKQMLAFDSDAVWFIQAWQSNPTSELLAGLNRIPNGKKHAVILDLYAEKTPHYMEGNINSTSHGYSPEFDGTNWIFCMLNNFGGRLGLHGHLDNLVTGVPEALNNTKFNVGIGITPEASQNNPLLYEFLFDSIWQYDANENLEIVDIDKWLADYSERRYGVKNENCEKAFRILKNTVYFSKLNNLGQGAPESIVNARPNFEIKAASTWGNAVISYDSRELVKSAELLLADYERLQDCDAYIYDVVTVIEQLLSNKAIDVHKSMKEAFFANDILMFRKASQEFLEIVDNMEKVTSCSEHYLLGRWIERAEKSALNTDDFTKKLYVFNAKELVTTWGAYNMCGAGGLHDYSNRQWSGLIETYYKPRWEYWINERIKELEGKSFDNNPNWFEFEWHWVRNTEKFNTKSKNYNLKEIFNAMFKD